MKRGWLMWVIAANLVVLVALVPGARIEIAADNAAAVALDAAAAALV